MKKAKLAGLSGLILTGLMAASCQIAPINASTVITNSRGAGTKTINAFVLVDGSSQIEPDTESMPGNSEYYYIDDVNFANPTYTPKSDGSKVNLIQEGIFTNPDNLTTPQAIWDQFNTVVASYVPTGFTFTVTEEQSSNWTDDYMTTAPGADVFAWKAYVYSLTYSFDSVADYISKTKTLMGSSYDISELKEVEDAGDAWAYMTNEGDGVYKFTEAYTVNYWSVYDIASQVVNSEYYNKDIYLNSLGTTINPDDIFSISLQQYKIGEADPVIVKVDNKNGLDDQLNVKYISAEGTFPSTPLNKTALILGIAAGVVVVGGAVTWGVLAKKKKKIAK